MQLLFVFVLLILERSMNPITLIAFGCSNTKGTESIVDYDEGINDTSLNHDTAYPKYLADALGYTYENYAENGISNQEISSKVFEITDTRKTNIFVVIGWTDDNRIAISKEPQKSSFTKTSNCCTINSSLVAAHIKHRLGHSLIPRERDNINYTRNISFETIAGLSEHIFSTQGFCDTNFFIKYATTLHLERYKIPFLTLPTIYTPYDVKYNYLHRKYNITNHDENGQIIFNMLDMYKQYGISSSGVHLKANAHKQLAYFLHDYVRKYKC